MLFAKSKFSILNYIKERIPQRRYIRADIAIDWMDRCNYR